jgi:hypothetical protein
LQVPGKAGAERPNPLNTFRKKFPKTGAEAASQTDAELEVDDLDSTRNAKVRGGIEVLHIKAGDTFNPYERDPDDRKGGGAKRDLRKLSEHIKLMRELEERRKQDDEEKK